MNYLSPKAVLGTAIVGLVGAAGVFLYGQLYAEKRRAMLIQEVARLDRQVSSMRVELEELRELQEEVERRRSRTRLRMQRRKAQAAARAAGAAGAAGGGGPSESGDALDAPDAEHSDSEYFTDYQSVFGTDTELDSEEYYDVHTDDEDDTLRETSSSGPDPPITWESPTRSTQASQAEGSDTLITRRTNNRRRVT